ncbi:glycerophosphodiester phosphodiesterase family protein [Aquirufa sp. HETE-40SA]
MGQSPVIQGHRGCRGLFPENSLPAFQHALEMGVTVLEMDVCLSADGQVVVSHEPYMNPLYASFPDGSPVTNASVNLFQKPYAEIKSFDVGSRGNKLFPEQARVATYKPLLSEVLALGEAFARKYGRTIYYNIEIKSEPSEYGITQPATVKEFADRVWSVISTHISPSSLILQSFDFAVLQYWKTAIHQGRISALVEKETPEQMLSALGFTPEIFSSSYRFLTKEQIDFCHARGMQVIPWTINTTAEMQKFSDWQVDGIITDYPNRAPQFLKP